MTRKWRRGKGNARPIFSRRKNPSCDKERCGRAHLRAKSWQNGISTTLFPHRLSSMHVGVDREYTCREYISFILNKIAIPHIGTYLHLNFNCSIHAFKADILHPHFPPLQFVTWQSFSCGGTKRRTKERKELRT